MHGEVIQLHSRLWYLRYLIGGAIGKDRLVASKIISLPVNTGSAGAFIGVEDEVSSITGNYPRGSRVVDYPEAAAAATENKIVRAVVKAIRIII